MIEYKGQISAAGGSRFLLDDADDIKRLPTTGFTYGRKNYPAPTAGSVAFVKETFERLTFDGRKWNDTSFGDLPTGGDTLTWDGNTEGLVVLNIVGELPLYKLTDNAPSFDDAVGGVEARFSFDDISAITTVAQLSDTVFVVGGLNVLVVSSDTETSGMFIPKGTYFAKYDAELYIKSLTIPGYTGFPVTKKIEEKYLPGATVLYTDGTYLYNTEDTTDESNRTTKAELWELYDRGRVDIDATALEMGKIRATVVSVAEETGLGYAVAQFVYMGIALVCYTAEYTPAETTGE